MEWKDIFEIAAIGVTVIGGYFTFKVNFERHEKEDNAHFDNVEKDLDSVKSQLVNIYNRLIDIDKKQAAYDEGRMHVSRTLETIEAKLATIEALLRSRRTEQHLE